VMQEEIFGPILPIISYDRLDDAIAYVNERPRPLALYWFGSDRANQERVLTNTISGGVTVNDAMMHFLQEDLPFGGIGSSGYGHYHGEHGFLRMSKEKPVFYQSRFASGRMLYPPYTRITERLVRVLAKWA
jgi:coniferyl-aldehyde dehydrogenase